MTIRERYESDNRFRSLVDVLHYTIEQGAFTPTEIREAAMLAQIKYEERHIRPVVFTLGDVRDGKL